MTHRISYRLAAALMLTLGTATNAHASSCIAEYKAKQDNPLRLDHGQITIEGPCTIEAVTPKVEQVLADQGWVLLKVLSVSEG